MPKIEVKNLMKSYVIDGRKLEILKGINLDIEPGEFIALLGKSGSGKTTLLTLLAGLDSPDSGHVVWDQTDFSQMSEEEMAVYRRGMMGFIFQSYHLIPTLTAAENIILAARLGQNPDALAATQSLLEAVGLRERQTHFPKQLSGGEQQRVAICRALVNSPQVILADEPTGNLDSQTGDDVLRLLRGLQKGRSLILVTHDKDVASKADRVIELKDGRLLA